MMQWEISALPLKAKSWEASHTMAAKSPTPLARRVQHLMTERGYGTNAKKLARDAKLNETYVRDLLEGRSRNARPDKLAQLAKPLRTTVAYLIGETDEGDATNAPADGKEEEVFLTAAIDELDVRASAGDGSLVETERKVSTWQLPRDLIKVATNAAPEKIKLITIIGDSMEPTLRPNEKVMVDTTDITPTPPGLFIVWDGLGLVAKRIEHIPHSDPPCVRITSDNPKYTPYERTLGEAYIQGRVLGKWLWT